MQILIMFARIWESSISIQVTLSEVLLLLKPHFAVQQLRVVLAEPNYYRDKKLLLDGCVLWALCLTPLPE